MKSGVRQLKGTQGTESAHGLCESTAPRAYLIVLQQDEAEVELAEGQFQVSDVPVLDSLLVGQVEDGLSAPLQRGGPAGLLLCVQGGLQLGPQGREPALRLRELLCGQREGRVTCEGHRRPKNTAPIAQITCQ